MREFTCRSSHHYPKSSHTLRVFFPHFPCIACRSDRKMMQNILVLVRRETTEKNSQTLFARFFLRLWECANVHRDETKSAWKLYLKLLSHIYTSINRMFYIHLYLYFQYYSMALYEKFCGMKRGGYKCVDILILCIHSGGFFHTFLYFKFFCLLRYFCNFACT